MRAGGDGASTNVPIPPRDASDGRVSGLVHSILISSGNNPFLTINSCVCQQRLTLEEENHCKYGSQLLCGLSSF